MQQPLLAVAAIVRKSVPDRVQLGEGIIQALSDHPGIFQNPSPPLATIRAATQELHDANIDAGRGAHVAKQQLKQAARTFRQVVHAYQLYVNLVAQGDGEIIVKSGLLVSRAARRAGRLAAPARLQLTGEVVGRLRLSVAPVEHARAYLWMGYVGDQPPTRDDDWRLLAATTQAKVVVRDLVSQSRLWVRCAAVGPKGLGIWSEPTTRVVL